MRNLEDKRRGLLAMWFGLEARLQAAGLDVEVDNNTDCDTPHLVVTHRPTEKWPDGRFLTIDSDLRMTVEDVIQWFRVVG